MKLIIQIPCYNEAKILKVALDDLPRSIEGVDEIEALSLMMGVLMRQLRSQETGALII